MAQTTALPDSIPVWQRARHYVPFLLSLLFSLWLLKENTQQPLLSSADILPLLPAFLMTGLAFTLLILRAGEIPACLLAAYMSTLAVLARSNTFSLSWLSDRLHAAPEPYMAGYAAVHIVWVFALGGVPLYFGWVYTEQHSAERRSPTQSILGLAFLSLCMLGQALCLYIAMRGIHGVIPLQAITSKIDSPYHRLIIYSAPVLLIEHAVAFWLLLRHFRRNNDARNRALVLIFGVTLLFVASVIINDTLALRETNLLANIMAYLAPLMVIYAIETHALFDIRIFIRRALQFTMARGILTLLALIPLVALAFLGYRVWIMTVNSGAGLPASHSANALLLALISLAVTVLAVVTLLWFDRIYFREIHDTQRVLGDTGRALIGVSDTGEIARTALAVIDIFLRPNDAIFLAEEDGALRCLAERARADHPLPHEFDRALLTLDQIENVPDLDHRLARARWTDTLSESTRTLLRERDTHLVIPLRETERTLGVILLGGKVSGATYAPEDIDMLRALASQVALALQNAYLDRNRAVLQRSTSELKAGSVSFVQLVERDRNLLAADLHDQTLPELRYLLAELQAWTDAIDHARGQTPPGQTPLLLPPPGRADPQAMVEHLRQTIANIRDIMESLRPSALEMLGLYPALESELRKSAARARPPVIAQFRVLNETRPAHLNSFAEISVFRIVQEAINNACRHAHATTVRVQIDASDGFWTLRVDDDGTGLPPNNPDDAPDAEMPTEPKETGRTQHGLYNMRYRANLIGAELIWETPDWGRGTSVVLRLPLNRPAEAQETHRVLNEYSAVPHA